MKVSLNLVALCLLMVGEAYAQTHNKVNISEPIEQENKPRFKISERRILIPTKEEQVSSFSMEELRVGTQRILDKAEIQYYKSQCRYAFMSDREVIEHRCETKKIAMPD
ncbi:hypothetical protein [Mannheimia pernigra]|uniref:hypothetical protein n=1 Tax=Mannheimia pernigra TaxID=111844 RepID=UPI00159F51AD|nr:hypothetical protein [Mannheimia pernigra]QLB44203.1 hypothetical protein HV561_05310 [Mannheimia pernigra]